MLKSTNNSWFACDVIAAMLVYNNNRVVITNSCCVHQHGRHTLCHLNAWRLSANQVYTNLPLSSLIHMSEKLNFSISYLFVFIIYLFIYLLAFFINLFTYLFMYLFIYLLIMYLFYLCQKFLSTCLVIRRVNS